MRKYFGIAALAATLALGSCATKTNAIVEPVPRAEIRMTSDFSEPAVQRTSFKNDVADISGQMADSLHITRIRTLISRVKLHDMEADSSKADRTFKSTPIILVAGADTTRGITTQPIAPGHYDAVKLHIHKLTESDARMVESDTNYRDFTTGERPTMIVEGVVFKKGEAQEFVYKTDVTADVTMQLQPPVRLKDDESGIIALRYDPFVIFKSGVNVLDPRDPVNKPHFDNMLRKSLRALKR